MVCRAFLRAVWATSKGVCSALVFGAAGDLAGDDSRPENAFRPMLSSFHLQESQQVAAIMLQADSIQERLIVVILQDTVAKMSGQLPFQYLVLQDPARDR